MDKKPRPPLIWTEPAKQQEEAKPQSDKAHRPKKSFLKKEYLALLFVGLLVLTGVRVWLSYDEDSRVAKHDANKRKESDMEFCIAKGTHQFLEARSYPNVGHKRPNSAEEAATLICKKEGPDAF